jgi:hypothetical protein
MNMIGMVKKLTGWRGGFGGGRRRRNEQEPGIRRLGGIGFTLNYFGNPFSLHPTL